MRQTSTTRRSRQRGAEIIEVTYIVIPLFALTFLLLDLAMVVFLRSTFQHAVRTGVRYAITGQNGTGPCQDDSIKAIVQKNSLGFLNSTAASQTIHVHWIHPVTGAVSNNAYGNIVEVSVEGYQYGPLAPFQRVGFPLRIWARASDMMEAVPAGLPCLTKLE